MSEVHPPLDRTVVCTRCAGTIFGAIIGVPIGGLCVGVCAWLIDYGDYAWEAWLAGALVGLPGGAIVGFLERTKRGQLPSADTATYVGGVFGLVISLLFLTGTGILVGGGNLTFFVWFGMLCAGPMLGILVGAIFDRVYESGRLGERTSAIGFAFLGLTICVAPAFLIVSHSDPDPREVEKDAMKLVLEHWRFDPVMKKARVRKVTLGPPIHREYEGEMEVMMEGQVIPYELTVSVRHGQIKGSWNVRP